MKNAPNFPKFMVATGMALLALPLQAVAQSTAPEMPGPPSAAQMPDAEPKPGMTTTDVPPSNLPDASKISADKSVVENAGNSPDHTTLVKAVTSAELDKALAAPGPITLFAPSNAGFDRLPPGTVDALLKPENQGSLAKILKNHIVEGKVTAADLSKKIKAGKGKAMLKTLTGDTLTATAEGATIKLTDSGGNASAVEKADIMGSNGVIHSINGVLIPTEKKPAQ
jgi:uncharacterized surface protein with fasciclin (FAS1) repeats